MVAGLITLVGNSLDQPLPHPRPPTILRLTGGGCSGGPSLSLCLSVCRVSPRSDHFPVLVLYFICLGCLAKVKVLSLLPPSFLRWRVGETTTSRGRQEISSQGVAPRAGANNYQHVILKRTTFQQALVATRRTGEHKLIAPDTGTTFVNTTVVVICPSLLSSLSLSQAHA